jgi:hypothetical protein
MWFVLFFYSGTERDKVFIVERPLLGYVVIQSHVSGVDPSLELQQPEKISKVLINFLFNIDMVYLLCKSNNLEKHLHRLLSQKKQECINEYCWQAVQK